MNHIKSRSDVEAISLYEASKQALEALETARRFVYSDNRPQCDNAINTLRTAIEAAESRSDVEKQSAEPVAWADPQDIARKGHDLWVANEQVDSYTMPLYTTPPYVATQLAAPVQELVCVCGAVWNGQELVEVPAAQEEIQRLTALVQAQQITIEKLEAQHESK